MLAEYIKTLREKKDLSQRQLSILTGISNTEISRIENRERQHPSLEVLSKLAPHLGVSVDTLIEKAGYVTSEKQIDTELGEIVKILENMSPEQRSKLIDIAKVIAPEAFGKED